MSDNQPPPYGATPGGQPGPYNQPNPYGQQNPYGQPGIPSYPGGGQQDPDAYQQEPKGAPPLANWGWRVLSSIIDSLISVVPYLIIIHAVDGGAGALVGLVILLGINLGISSMEGTTGQSPGKKAVGTRLIRESDGQPIGFGLAFGRRLLHILDALPCYLGYLWPAWDAKRQTFADKIVSSVVVKL